MLFRSASPTPAPASTVAPLAGAWIETMSKCLAFARHRVAPLAGAWIETGRTQRLRWLFQSRPLRARGLKQALHSGQHADRVSRPLRARGLKQQRKASKPKSAESRPLRARGLKHEFAEQAVLAGRRAPHGARELKRGDLLVVAEGICRAPHGARELKPEGLYLRAEGGGRAPHGARELKRLTTRWPSSFRVAPLAGAWIETSRRRFIRYERRSRPLWARGLKPR